MLRINIENEIFKQTMNEQILPKPIHPTLAHNPIKIKSDYILEGQKMRLLGEKYEIPELDDIVQKRQATVELKWMRILKGLEPSDGLLPELPMMELRLFIPSTYSDFKLERCWFLENVLPRLKQFFQNFNPFSLYGLADLDYQNRSQPTKLPPHWPGIDVRISDTRWAMVDSAVDNHIVEKICLQEIEICSEQSLGAFILAFVGNRYGYKPVPAEIPSLQFRLLRKIAFRCVKHTAPLLDAWYKEDTNSKEPVFILQPITSRIDGYRECILDTFSNKNFVDEYNTTMTSTDGFLAVPNFKPKEEHTLRRKAGHKWWCQAEALKATIRRATKWILDYLSGNVHHGDHALSKTELIQIAQKDDGFHSKSFWQSLTMSVIESEVLYAVYGKNNSESVIRRELGLSPSDEELARGKRCFIYDRELLDWNEAASRDDNAWKYSDLVLRDGKSVPNGPAQAQLNAFKACLCRMSGNCLGNSTDCGLTRRLYRLQWSTILDVESESSFDSKDSQEVLSTSQTYVKNYLDQQADAIYSDIVKSALNTHSKLNCFTNGDPNDERITNLPPWRWTSSQKELALNITQNWRMCKEICDKKIDENPFFDNRALKRFNYLSQFYSRRTMIITANPGDGISTEFSLTVQDLQKSLSSSTVETYLILHFSEVVSFSDKHTVLNELLINLIQQICWIYEFEPANYDQISTEKDSLNTFLDLINVIENGEYPPLILAMDSFDKILNDNQLKTFFHDIAFHQFATNSLSFKVKFLISLTNKNLYNLLKDTEPRYDILIFELEPLSYQDVASVTGAFFDQVNRCLTEEQWLFVLESLECHAMEKNELDSVIETQKSCLKERYGLDNEILSVSSDTTIDSAEAWEILLEPNNKELSSEAYLTLFDIKMAIHTCCIHWRSYDFVKDLWLPSLSSTNFSQDCFDHFCDHLEASYGVNLVSHTLAFISTGLLGITEVELEDVLSCQDCVLNEIYSRSDPIVTSRKISNSNSVPNSRKGSEYLLASVQPTIHLPGLIWARLYYHLKPFLMKVLYDGKLLLQWRNSKMKDYTLMRYIDKDLEKNNLTIVFLHSELADVIGAESPVKKTCFFSNNFRKAAESHNNRDGKRLSSNIPGELLVVEADRGVSHGQLVHAHSSQEMAPNVNNPRRLKSLFYHLTKSERWLDLLEKCLLNVEFLSAFIAVISPVNLLVNIRSVIEALGNQEQPKEFKFVESLEKVLENCLPEIQDLLEKDSSLDGLYLLTEFLSFQFLKQLDWNEQLTPLIEKFKESCEHILKFNGPAFLPSNRLGLFHKKKINCEKLFTDFDSISCSSQNNNVLITVKHLINSRTNGDFIHSINFIDMNTFQDNINPPNWTVLRSKCLSKIKHTGIMTPRLKRISSFNAIMNEHVLAMDLTKDLTQAFILTNLGRLVLIHENGTVTEIQVEMEKNLDETTLIISPDGNYVLLNTSVDKNLLKTQLIRKFEKNSGIESETCTRFFLKCEYGFFQGINRAKSLWIPETIDNPEDVQRTLATAKFINNEKLICGVHSEYVAEKEFAYSVSCWQVVAMDEYSKPQFLWTINLFRVIGGWPRCQNNLMFLTRHMTLIQWDWNHVTVFCGYQGLNRTLNLSCEDVNAPISIICKARDDWLVHAFIKFYQFSRPKIGTVNYESDSRIASILIRERVANSLLNDSMGKYDNTPNFYDLIFYFHNNRKITVLNQARQKLTLENPENICASMVHKNLIIATLNCEKKLKIWTGNHENNLENIHLIKVLDSFLESVDYLKIHPLFQRPRIIIYENKAKKLELLHFDLEKSNETEDEINRRKWPLVLHESFYQLNDEDLLKVELKNSTDCTEGFYHLKLGEIKQNGEISVTQNEQLKISMKLCSFPQENDNFLKTEFLLDNNSQELLLFISSNHEALIINDSTFAQIIILSYPRHRIDHKPVRLLGKMSKTSAKWLIDWQIMFSDEEEKTRLIVLSVPSRFQSYHSNVENLVIKDPFKDESNWLVTEGILEILSIPRLMNTCAQRRFICPLGCKITGLERFLLSPDFNYVIFQWFASTNNPFEKKYQLWSGDLTNVPAAFGLVPATESNTGDRKLNRLTVLNTKAIQHVSHVFIPWKTMNMKSSKFSQKLGSIGSRDQTELVVLSCDWPPSLLTWNLTTGVCITLKIADEDAVVKKKGLVPKQRFGESLKKLDKHGITCICGDSEGTIATGDSKGQIVIFNLFKAGYRKTDVKKAHCEAITCLKWLKFANQQRPDLLISGSKDQVLVLIQLTASENVIKHRIGINGVPVKLKILPKSNSELELFVTTDQNSIETFII